MGSINRLARQRKVISRPDYATKSYMAGASVDHLRMPGRRTVPSAVVRRTEIRAALDHLARDTDAGLRRVVAEGLQAAFDRAAGAFRMAPAGARQIGPAAANVTQVRRASGHEKNRAAGGQETG